MKDKYLDPVINEIITNTSIIGGTEEEKYEFVDNIINVVLAKLLQHLIPVITNIMTLSIPRLLFIITIFSEHKIITYEQQVEVIKMFAENVRFNPNMSDEDFSKQFVNTVLKYKETKGNK